MHRAAVPCCLGADLQGHRPRTRSSSIYLRVVIVRYPLIRRAGTLPPREWKCLSDEERRGLARPSPLSQVTESPGRLPARLPRLQKLVDLRIRTNVSIAGLCSSAAT